MAEILSEALPDLVVLVRRDGVVMGHVGGNGVGALVPPAGASGERLEMLWPESAATCVKQAVRRCIAERKAAETRFDSAEVRYELRAFPQGPDRALCVIRIAAPDAPADESTAAEPAGRPHFDRRGFLARFTDTLSLAALQEKPAALALIHLDGLGEIARVVDTRVSEQVLSAAIVRLPHAARLGESRSNDGSWYLGQLSADMLAIVIESADRDTIEHCVSSVCASLRQPQAVGDASFHLTPYAGVSILGQDGWSPNSLLDKARSAAIEARRSNSDRIHFFTDTLKLRSLARLDVAREIREAIDARDIRLRYTGRHDLASGRLVAQVGYLRWHHGLRGELAPADFLGVAETTGLATLLSRSLLDGLQEDYEALAPELPADARLSFGPLRHHLLQDDFVDDITAILGKGGLPASRLEIRISERSFAAMNLSPYQELRRLGVQIVIDEMGRGFGSLDRLARAPIWGLQLDRAWVTAIRSDSVALRVCRAGISAAVALGLTPIAMGVDDVAQRDALLELGCRHGSGNLYRGAGQRFDTLLTPVRRPFAL